MTEDRRASNMLNVPEDQPLWRVFKIEHLLGALERGENVLVKPRIWDDPFENFLSRCTVRLTRANVTVSLEGIYSAFYGQCWTEAYAETDATWRLYAPGADRAVRVRVRAGRLFDTIWDPADLHSPTRCFLGKVQYLSENDIRQLVLQNGVNHTFDSVGRGQAATLLIKRQEFAHEHEVRLLFNVIDSHTATDNLRRFQCSAVELFEELVLDPRLSQDEAKQLTARVQSLGYSGPVTQSPLYRIPTFPTLSLDA